MKNIFKRAVTIVLIASICMTGVFAATQNNLKKTVENLTVENGIISTKVIATQKPEGQDKEIKVLDADVVVKKIGVNSDWRFNINTASDSKTLKPYNTSPISFSITKRGDVVKLGFPELVLTVLRNLAGDADLGPEEQAEFAEALRRISGNNYITLDKAKEEAEISKADEEKIKKLVSNYQPLYLKVQKDSVSYTVNADQALKELENIKKYILKNQKTINSIEMLKEEGTTPTQSLIENIDESKISIEESLKSLKIFAGPQGYKLMCEQDTGEKLMIQSTIRKGTDFKLNDFKGRELTEEEMQSYSMLLFMGIMTSVMDQVEADRAA